eukprot:COSAG02_NODE_1210_length_13856_cov_12.266182_11_plen_229_part_00
MAPLRGAESLSQTLSLLRPTHTKVSSAHKILRDYYTIKYNLSTYLLRSSPRVRESGGFSYLIIHSHATNSYSYSAGLPVVTLHSSFRLIMRHSVDASIHVFIDIITSNFACFAFRMFRISRREIGHFAFRGAKSDISHFAARNRTLYISRRETGHSGMTKYQIEYGARHSQRVSGAAGDDSDSNVSPDHKKRAIVASPVTGRALREKGQRPPLPLFSIILRTVPDTLS